MEPSPREEGFGRRAGSFDIRNVLLIPRDPRGIVLVCGLVVLAAFGAYALLAAGDPIGFAFIVAAAAGYLFVRSRFVPIVVWAVVAAYGILAATAGNPSAWLVAGLAVVLLLVAVFPPVDWTESSASTSRELVVASVPVVPPAVVTETSGTLEVPEGSAPNGSHQASGQPIELQAAVAPVGSPHLSLRTIGALELDVDGVDQTRRIHEQRRLEFLLSYLIAHWISSLGAPLDRAALGAELAPAYDSSTQLNRVRKHLHLLKVALGPELQSLIKSTSSHVRLDLTGIAVDFVALSTLAAKVDRRRGLVDAELATEIRSLLETTAGGEFLAGFSELEHEVTDGRGDAARVVDDARMKVNGWRADLVVALARHFEAAGHAQSSIAYLQAAGAQSPEREDVGRLLVAAYMQTGQLARAEEVRAAYKFSLGEIR